MAFLYVAIRVFTVDITYDEAWTYFEYVQYPVYQIVSGYSPRANNHILNTLLTKLCCIVSTHQFALRLPNLLAFMLYLYSINKIADLLFNKSLLKIALVICVISNYTLLEFFGLCRGYGLGISCLMFAIYQLLQYPNNHNNRHLHYALLFSIAATYANFSLLFATSGIFTCVIYISYRFKKTLWYSLKLLALYASILFILCAYPIWCLINADELYYGGKDNFINDTLSSLLVEYIGYNFYHAGKYVSIIVLSALLTISAACSFIGVSKKKSNALVSVIPAIVLLIAILFTNLAFYIANSLLPISRTALYLYPLIILTAFSAIALLHQKHSVVATVLTCTWGLFNLFVCIPNLNFHQTREWWDEAYCSKVLQYISNDSKEKTITLWAFFPTTNTFNYYIEHRYADKMQQMPCCIKDYREAIVGNYDYLYLRNTDDVSAYHQYTPVQTYHDGAFILYKKQR